jgi:hypothetical protein
MLLRDGTWVWCQVIGQRQDRHGRWCGHERLRQPDDRQLACKTWPRRTAMSATWALSPLASIRVCLMPRSLVSTVGVSWPARLDV